MANEKQHTELDHEFWAVVGQGRRAAALASGELVAVPDDAPHGFGQGRAAFTKAAFERSGAHDRSRRDQVLLAAAERVLEHQRSGKTTTDRLLFAAPASLLGRPVPLLLVVGPGDEGRNVLTLMLPEEAPACPM